MFKIYNPWYNVSILYINLKSANSNAEIFTNVSVSANINYNISVTVMIFKVNILFQAQVYSEH